MLSNFSSTIDPAVKATIHDKQENARLKRAEHYDRKPHAIQDDIWPEHTVWITQDKRDRLTQNFAYKP